MLYLMITEMVAMVIKRRREAMDMRKKMGMVMVRRKIITKRRDMISMVIKSTRTNSQLRKIIQVWTRV